MKLKGKITARCKAYNKRETAGKKKDALTALMPFEIVTTPAQAKKLYGHEFAEACFCSTMKDEAGNVRHRLKVMTPNDDFRPVKHAVEINGTEVVVQPILGNIHTIESTEKVMVKLTLPVYVGPGSDVGQALELCAGTDCELAFAETQKELPFEEETTASEAEEE